MQNKTGLATTNQPWMNFCDMEKPIKVLPWWKEIFLKNNLAEYYRLKRQWNSIIGKSQKMKLRKLLHPFLIMSMKLSRKINKQTITVLNSELEKNDKTVIYAVTHVGYYDYQIISEVLKKHQIPFCGDPEHMYRSMDGLLMWLNGVIYCDTENKSDRKTAYKTAIDLLKKGNNITIYPEGVWNVTSNLLMLPLFPGVIRMGIDTGANIVPIAIEQYDKEFVINIGESICLDRSLFERDNDKRAHIEQQKRNLREIMANLKWEIIESRGIHNRKEFVDYKKEKEKFLGERINEWIDKKTGKSIYNKDLITRRIYKEK